MVHQMAIATLNHPISQSDQPDKNNTETQEQAANTVCLLQLGGFQVKPMPFHIAVHFFHPHALTIDFQ